MFQTASLRLGGLGEVFVKFKYCAGALEADMV